MRLYGTIALIEEDRIHSHDILESNIKTESVVFLCGHYTSIIVPLIHYHIYIFTSLFPSLLHIPLCFIHQYYYHVTQRLAYQTCLINKWVSTRVIIVNGLSKYNLGFDKKLRTLMQWTWEHAKWSTCKDMKVNMSGYIQIIILDYQHFNTLLNVYYRLILKYAQKIPLLPWGESEVFPYQSTIKVIIKSLSLWPIFMIIIYDQGL